MTTLIPCIPPGLAQDGNDVAVNDIASKQAELVKLVEDIQRMGRKSVTIPADISKEPEVQAIVQKTVEELGGLDIVSLTFPTVVHLLCLIIVRWWPMQGFSRL